MHRPVLVTPPAETPVSRTEAKAHLRVDGTGDDDLIDGLIDAAVAHLDGYTGILGRCMVTQTWRQDFDDFARIMRLPLLAAGIATIVYVDDEGATSAAIDTANYELQHDERGSFVRFVDSYSLPGALAETRAVRVTFTAGYGAASAVPGALKTAIILLISKLYATARRDMLADRETVEGIGSTSWAAPELAAAVIDNTVALLIAPYRRAGV